MGKCSILPVWTRVTDLEQLVEGAEATREDDEALGVLDEHRLAHEEVAEA